MRGRKFSMLSTAQALLMAVATVLASLMAGNLVHPGKGLVCVLVEPGLHGEVRDAVELYASDLRAEGYSVDVIASSWGTPSQLRDYLRLRWAGGGLVGCLMLGALPSAWFEFASDPTNGGLESQFPMDLYFTDLDGVWEDSDMDGVLDIHTAGRGDLAPEIWLGRVAMSTSVADEGELVSGYLAKVHAFRSGGIPSARRALLYVDEDWLGEMGGNLRGLQRLYPDTTVVNGVHITNASNFEGWLAQEFEWAQVLTHDDGGGTGHAFSVDDGQDNDGDGVVDERGEGGTVTSLDLRSMNATPLFYNLFTCAAANYLAIDYLAGWYVLSGGRGLCAVGSTKSGGMLNTEPFYASLAKGQCVGEAFRRWFSATAESHFGPDQAETSRAWFYGMTIIGDPTLTPLGNDH